MSRGSAVGLTTGCGLDNRGVGIRVPVVSFRPALRYTQPPIQWLPGALSPGGGVKRQGYEANNALPTSVEVKKTWICTSTPPYASTA
jgi:hypothetical protein